MKKVLIINSSARLLGSQSRKLIEVFVDHWKGIHNDPAITFRELGNTGVPHINECWTAAAFKPGATRSEAEIEALKTSDAYIAELREADVIVLGSPMYNWSIPSALRAYIDQILRVNETFNIDRSNPEYPYIGLLENKTLVLLLSRGENGYEKGGYNEHLDFQSTYLKAIFSMIGISKIHVIAANGASYDREKFKERIATAHQDIKELIERELA